MNLTILEACLCNLGQIDRLHRHPSKPNLWSNQHSVAYFNHFKKNVKYSLYFSISKVQPRLELLNQIGDICVSSTMATQVSVQR